jgi:hypothetical protein
MNLKFCVVNDEYLRYLQSFDFKVMNPNSSYALNSATKFVVGVLIEVNNFSYYAQLSSIKPTQVSPLDPDKLNPAYKEFSFPIRGKVREGNKHVNVIKALIRLGFMFPVNEGDFKELEFNSLQQPYRDFVLEEYRYCKKNIEQIRSQASEVYKKRTCANPTPHTIQQCCDFKLLEARLTEWMAR